MTTAGLVVGSLSCIVIASLFICIALALYLGYAQGEEMTKHFKNSSSSITSATHRHSGPYGKMQLVGGISFVVTFPRFFLKHVILDAEDNRNLTPFAPEAKACSTAMGIYRDFHLHGTPGRYRGIRNT